MDMTSKNMIRNILTVGFLAVASYSSVFATSSQQATPNLKIIDHPLIAHKLSIMREKQTKPYLFRQLLNEIALLMGYEVTRDFPLKSKTIETPMSETKGYELGREVVIVPILRAGLGMVAGLQTLVPTAKVGHIGLYRDPETKKPVEYYCKLPSTENSVIVVIDPMLATGGSAVTAVQKIKEKAFKHSQIIFMSLVAAPEGVAKLTAAFPDIKIYTAALDEKLNDHAYIVPGLGDAGDRLFGTK